MIDLPTLTDYNFPTKGSFLGSIDDITGTSPDAFTVLGYSKHKDYVRLQWHNSPYGDDTIVVAPVDEFAILHIKPEEFWA